MDQEHRDYLSRVLRRYVNNPHDREDVVQNAMLNAFKWQDSYKGKCSYKSWLYFIAKSTAIKFFVEQDKLSNEVIDDEWLENQPWDDGTLAKLELMELAEKVKDEVFWLYYRDGMTEGEIRQRTGMKLSTIRSRLKRTRDRLWSQ